MKLIHTYCTPSSDGHDQTVANTGDKASCCRGTCCALNSAIGWLTILLLVLMTMLVACGVTERHAVRIITELSDGHDHPVASAEHMLVLVVLQSDTLCA